MRSVALALVLALAACGPAVEQRRLTARFTYGFEHNVFSAGQPRGEEWCLASRSVEMLGVERPPFNSVVAVDLTVDAEVSPPGQYGHMGMCAREVLITRIVERSQPYCPYSADLCARLEELAARD
jgi:hypothetical protein